MLSYDTGKIETSGISQRRTVEIPQCPVFVLKSVVHVYKGSIVVTEQRKIFKETMSRLL